MPTVQPFLRSLSSASEPPCWIALGTLTVCALAGVTLRLEPQKAKTNAAIPALLTILRIGSIPPTLTLHFDFYLSKTPVVLWWLIMATLRRFHRTSVFLAVFRPSPIVATRADRFPSLRNCTLSALV